MTITRGTFPLFPEASQKDLPPEFSSSESEDSSEPRAVNPRSQGEADLFDYHSTTDPLLIKSKRG